MGFELELNPKQKCIIILKREGLKNINQYGKNLNKRGKHKTKEKT